MVGILFRPSPFIIARLRPRRQPSFSQGAPWFVMSGLEPCARHSELRLGLKQPPQTLSKIALWRGREEHNSKFHTYLPNTIRDVWVSKLREHKPKNQTFNTQHKNSVDYSPRKTGALADLNRVEILSISGEPGIFSTRKASPITSSGATIISRRMRC